jgi:23S rRNA maturation-related 3'-5' exoribonuclease YhaM
MGGIVMKSKIIELLMSTERKGITDLIKHMENNGFFEAPCSGQYHLCEVGGLAAHSINVFNVMTRSYGSQYEFGIGAESIIIVSLLHDLGKMGQYGKQNYIPNKLKSGEISKTKPFETNKDLLPVPHEIRSIHIASQFIELTEEEAFAILHHNGLYGDLKYQLQGKETPLQMLLHFADMWASRVIEKE